MAKSVRMADIAEKLGVSIVTVSKALGGKEGVSEELRSNIIKLADEMGYCTKKIANNALASDSYVIGILTAHCYLEEGSSFYWSLYERVIANLSSSGDFGILEVVGAAEIENCTVPRVVQEKRVDGIIIMGIISEDYIKMLSKLNIPLVMLDNYNARMNYDTVISDGYYGMYAMTDYLINMGHKKIMYVGTVGATSSITDRYYGYCRAMLESGIEVKEDMVISDRGEDGKCNITLPADIKQNATALACNCDFIAYTVLNKLTAMGIKVPDDISIVGFDNYMLSEISSVKLTTYGVNIDRMARTSVIQIRHRIKNPSAVQDVKVISGEILIRDSVKKID